MINNIVLLSEKDKHEYLSTSQKKIDYYANDLQRVLPLFDIIKAEVPTSSYANFRDALFHFYKMKTLVDELQIIKEIYAMEEHLNRGIKDTIISLYQNFSVRIEYLMLINQTDNQKLYDLLEPKFMGWANLKIDEIIQKFSKLELNPCFFNQAIILFLLKFNEQELWKKNSIMRKSLHNVKNECLRIRSISMSIERPWETSMDVTKKYCDVFQNNILILQNNNLYAFVPFSYNMYSMYKEIKNH